MYHDYPLIDESDHEDLGGDESYTEIVSSQYDFGDVSDHTILQRNLTNPILELWQSLGVPSLLMYFYLLLVSQRCQLKSRH